MANPWIIVYGDPFSGFTVVGPFDTYKDALLYGQSIKCPTFWIDLLYSPQKTGTTPGIYEEMSEEEAQMYCDQEELHPEDFYGD